MTKNEDSASRQTIRVLAPDGRDAGSTYPKRAAGLVKKGRACYVNDFTIRLNMSDAIHKSEVMKMDNMNNIEAGRNQEEGNVLKLYFDARQWRFNESCDRNVGNRSFMVGPDGTLAEAYMIGNWSWDWTEIISDLLLPKYTDCTFTFWLNGGENDRYNEVCRFEVILDDDYNQRFTFNLNRNFIPPLKKLNGWELYEIPFRTLGNERTQLRFVAQAAYMTVMEAKDAAAYAQFADIPDPFESERPQRHNLIFPDGFPKDKWYGTEQLIAKYREEARRRKAARSAAGGEADRNGGYPAQLEEFREKLDDIAGMCGDIESFDTEGFIRQLRGALEEAFESRDASDLEEIISDTVEEVQCSLDAAGDIQSALEELSDQMEELKESLLEE